MPIDSDSITLRNATFDDWEMLLRWRNDPVTRQNSHHTQHVSEKDHQSWLQATLKNPNRRLQIAMRAGRAVGTVRSDWLAESATSESSTDNSPSTGSWLLSWTVNPDCRGQGVAKQMVQAVVAKITQPIRAEIRKDNLASIRVAESAGLHPLAEVDDFVHYFRPAVE